MDRALLKTTALCALGTAALAALLYWFVDRPVDLAAHALRGSFWFSAGQTLSLLAGHQLFNLLLMAGFLWVGIGALHRGFTPGLRKLFYCCLAVAAAMICGEAVKWLLGRYRPEMLIAQGLYGFSFFADSGSRHSFPSGHTLRIFSAMTALSLLWPRAGGWLLGLAVLVGVSRVLVARHYPSDVLVGAFIGVFSAIWVWRIMQPRALKTDNPPE
jgi:membrane-associated phospholipid phosphatase